MNRLRPSLDPRPAKDNPMSTSDFYIAAPGQDYPLAYCPDQASGESELARICEQHAGAYIISPDVFWNERAECELARFPLTRVSEQFYDAQLTELPPIYLKNGPGFVVSEAVINRIHAQFFEWRGRFYAGYANLGSPRKVWTYEDAEALECRPESEKPTLDWYPD